MRRLKPVEKKLLLAKIGAEVVQIKAKQIELDGENQNVMLIRIDDSLLCFHLDRSVGQWNYLWKKDALFSASGSIKNTPWLVSSDGFIVAKTETGIQIYKLEKSLTLKHLVTDGRYHDAYGWSQADHVVLIGFFYSDPENIGIWSRNGEGKVSFETVVKSEALMQSALPIWKIDTDPVIPTMWQNIHTDITLVYADSTPQQAFMSRTMSEISIFKLAKNNLEETVISSSLLGFPEKNEKIFFGKFSPGIRKINNLLHLNETGLTGYRYNISTQSLQPYMYVAQFSKKLGWTQSHLETFVLEDLDGDGIDEMLYSGPSGFNVIKMSSEEIPTDIILSEKDFDVSNRYVKQVVVLQKIQNEQHIILVSETRLTSFKLQLQSYIGNSYQNQTNLKHNELVNFVKATPFPLVIKSSEYRSVLPLHDQLDFKEFIYPRNPLLGTLDFSVPLVEIPNVFGITISQTIKFKEYGSSDVMGEGWSLPIDCIYIDRQGSILPVDHNYYLVKNGMQSHLHPILDESSTNLSFTLHENLDIKIKFFKSENKWEVKTKEETYSYGTFQNIDWIQWEPVSEQWPLRAKSSTAYKVKPFAWFLSKKEDNYGNFIKYAYKPEYGKLSTGVPYVQRLDLIKITSSNGDSLRFTYGVEYTTKLLTSMLVRTSCYSQNIQFEYTVVEKLPRLTSVSQQNMPVLQFKYQGPKNEMTEIIYPNGLITKFSYSSFEFTAIQSANKFNFFSNVNIVYGPNYLLIGGKTEAGQLRIQARDVVGSATTSMSALQFPVLGKEPVLRFELLPAEQFFVVALEYSTHKEMCLFRKKSDGWSSDASYMQMPKNSTIHIGKSFLLVKRDRNLATLQYSREQWEVQPVLNNIMSDDIIKAFSYGYVVYNDTRLLIGFQNDNGSWEIRNIPIVLNLVKSSLSVFDHFETDEKTIENLKTNFKKGILNVHHNAIIIRSLSLEGQKLFQQLHFKIFDSKFELFHDETVSVLVENLDQYLLELPPIDENLFKIGYKLKDGKLQVAIKSHLGKIIDEVNGLKEKVEEEIRKHPEASEREKFMFRKENYDKLDNQLNEIYNNVTSSIPFALDPAKFDVYVNNDNVVTASHKFQFNGHQWILEKIAEREINLADFRLNIGTSYVLLKSGKNETFKLYDKQDQLIWDLNTKFGEDLLLSYPEYLGVQQNRSAEVFTFKNRKLHKLPDGEFLSRMSNPVAIVTITDNQKSAIVRPVKSFNNYRQSVMTKQELYTREKDIQFTIFEYDSNHVVPFSDGYAFSKSKIIPDGNSQKYGWYEDTFNMAEIKNSSRTVHNSDGIIVKAIESDKIKRRKDFNYDTVTTDKMGKFEIVDFRPYRLTDEVVAYYGFESYEKNLIGSKKNWIFDSKMITKESFNYFLRLAPNSSIEGHFRPKLKRLSIIFSCWIRIAQEPFNADIVNLNVVDLNGQLLHQFKGAMKHKIADWHYVEVIYNGGQMQSDVSLVAKIKNPSSYNVDIDHLRLTPLNFEFQANIMESRHGKTRAVLKNSGLLQQTLYDPYGNEIGRVSDMGLLETFIMKSLNCAIFKNKNHISRVEMRPKLGEIDPIANGMAVQKTLTYIPDMFSFRFLYKINGLGNIKTTLDQLNISIVRNSDQTTFNFNNEKPHIIDSEGEATILMSSKKFSIWVQGHLLMEHPFSISYEKTSEINIKSTGQAFISEIFYLYDPTVKIFYLNKLGLLIQEIVLIDQDSINIRQIVYDAIDRPVLKTKWIQLQPGANSFFNYNSRVIINLDNILTSVKAEGLASDLNLECQGLPFTWTSYRNDPLDVKIAYGLPGKDYSVKGQYSSKFGSNVNHSILNLLFPSSMGYRHDFEAISGGSLVIKIYDQRQNKVGILVKVVNHDHRLTTFEYDSQNRLVCELPPIYHDKVKTLSKIVPYGQQKLSPNEAKLKDLWSKHYKYDYQGRVTEKITPDSGKLEFVYNYEGLLKFLVQQNRNSCLQSIIYFHYRYDGKIVERGIIDVPRDTLNKYLPNNASVPKSNNFILFDYGENEIDSKRRNLMQRSKKVSNNTTVAEALIFNGKRQLLNQIFFSQKSSLSFNFIYHNDKIYQIEYPFFMEGKQLKISYTRNLNRKITAVKAGSHIIADLKYNPLGYIKEIQFQPTNKFSYKRWFDYNEPGYIVAIRDMFLSEKIDYITNSYGGQSFGDGTISAVKLNASWHEYSDLSRIKLKWQSLISKDTTEEQARLCYEALQKLDYFDEWNRPKKSFYPSSELQMPLVCNTGSRANHISSIISTQGFPMVYGHRYDYENHKQLIKAKYYQNLEESNLDPLTHLTFSTHIRQINATESLKIWTALKNAGFIITDCTNSKNCHTLQGKSLFHPVITNHINRASLEILFASGVKSRRDIPQEIFMAVCQIWHTHDSINKQSLCTDIWNELLSHDLVGQRSEKSIKALNPELKLVLKNYSRHLRDIVTILDYRFTHSLGKSAGDVQSYDIDPNGNHVHFYTGFKRYRLEYAKNTNKITKVFCIDLRSEDLRENEFLMDHDFEGNVTKAMHKDISKIVYDPLLKRAIQIHMVDGRSLTFQYDVRGSRIFKQVKDITGRIIKEKYYMRDLKGRCLVDYELTYLQNGREPYTQSTAYVYADDVLVGYLRNDQFYSVFTDHEGSIRLVVKDGEVVAAYDYLPYGQLLRKYITDINGSIDYLYTGQEWDEETELYNFHARMYDPEIGRFYQIDPKEQYPSPYVYAGNSPISLVDPDGQFAFLAIVAFAAIGSFLGASAANNSFNPTKWTLKPTLIGGVMGGILGGFAPAGIGASFAFLTTTVGLSGVIAGGVMATTSISFAYLSGASVNKIWNPAEWNWSSPGTWNSLFSGSLTGATLFAGVGKVHAKFISLNGLTNKVIFASIVTSSTAGVALFTGSAGNDWNLSFWEWDWKNPDTVWKVTMGASFGMSVSPELNNIQQQVSQKVKDFRSLITQAKSGNLQSLVPDTKKYFEESAELFLLVKTTFQDLAKQVLRQGNAALAQTIATDKTYRSNKVISTIKSVLFESSKVLSIQNATDELIDSLDVLEQGRDKQRRRRDLQCCELQIYDHLNSKDQIKCLSSSGSMKFSIFGDIFKYLNSCFKSDSAPKFFSNDVGSTKIRQTVHNMFTLNNCYRITMRDQSTRIRCYDINTLYDIYPTGSETNIVNEIYHDCVPIEYDGQPSVVCFGSNSNLIFTPKPSINILDLFNGWLMLALITPSAIKILKQAIETSFTPNNAKKILRSSPEILSKVNKLNHKMMSIEKKIALVKSSNINSKWITYINDDLIDDIEKYSKKKSMLGFDDLLDRIGAFDDELVEMIGLVNNFKKECGTANLSRKTNIENYLQNINVTSIDIGNNGAAQRNMLNYLTKHY